jgi:hypothetical protein
VAAAVKIHLSSSLIGQCDQPKMFPLTIAALVLNQKRQWAMFGGAPLIG